MTAWIRVRVGIRVGVRVAMKANVKVRMMVLKKLFRLDTISLSICVHIGREIKRSKSKFP